MRTIIISDVHITAGSLNSFNGELTKYLCNFICSLFNKTTPTELIINGDFFDFVLTAPWENIEELTSYSTDGIRLCFTEQQSCKKLTNIINEHQQVFDTLGQFLSINVNNRILMLPGNHDVDLFWPEVQKRLKETIKDCVGDAANRFTFYLEEYYLLEREGRKYRIEHGHQHDIVNRFTARGKKYWGTNNLPIFEDVKGQARLLECNGTYALIRYVNPINKNYSTLAHIKPMSRLLHVLVKSEKSISNKRAILVCWYLARFLSSEINVSVLGPGDVSREMLCELVDSMDLIEQESFMEFLSNKGLPIHQTLTSFVKDRSNCADILNCECFAQPLSMVAPLNSAVITEDTLGGYGANSLWDYETHVLNRLAINEKRRGRANYFITGHTHDATSDLSNGPYLNSGCWVPNFIAENSQEACQALTEEIPLPYTFTYVEIPEGGNGTPRIQTFLTGEILPCT